MYNVALVLNGSGSTFSGIKETRTRCLKHEKLNIRDRITCFLFLMSVAILLSSVIDIELVRRKELNAFTRGADKSLAL
jgi:hypothetical protein